MENLGYLFAAFTIIWLMVFGYCFILMKRQNKLKKDIEILRQYQKDSPDL